MTGKIPLIILLSVSISLTVFAKSVYVDADTDCFYIPQKVAESDKRVPALLYLSCTGAVKSDLDSLKFIGDSLGWILFSCHKTRNHRDPMQNDLDIMKTYKKAIKKYQIDTTKVFVYGFSGQGVQAYQEMFMHPTKFKGVHAVCAHTGAMSFAKWSTLNGHIAYLISREKDWNLNENILIDQAFLYHGIRDTLVVTLGEHGIGDKYEIWNAIKWLKNNISSK